MEEATAGFARPMAVAAVPIVSESEGGLTAVTMLRIVLDSVVVSSEV